MLARTTGPIAACEQPDHDQPDTHCRPQGFSNLLIGH
jgi:hypothetical protein